jgi:hypothetical protein
LSAQNFFTLSRERRFWFPRLSRLTRWRKGSGAQARPAGKIITLDRVVAVVNDDALTQFDLDEQKRSVLRQMKAQNVTPPPNDVLEKQLLERMIVEHALLQYAKGERRPRRRCAGRADDPAHRAGKQDVERRLSQGSRARRA